MSRPDSATETAQSIASLVRDCKAFPDEAARQLLELLSHSLAAPSAAERREARLGLLIDVVSQGEGEFVTTEAYERERSIRRAGGETWPTASSLSRAYGSWLSALRAACRFWFEGGAARVASDHRHAKPSQTYKPIEIRSAILKAQADMNLPAGEWPTEWEFQEWAQIKRRLARLAGSECRIPGAKQIRKAYGGYAAAVAAARRVSQSDA